MTMGTENAPDIEVRWFDSNLGTWQDITADVEYFRVESKGVLRIPTVEIGLYNNNGKYTNTGSANYIDHYSILRVKADVRGVGDTIFLGRVDKHLSKFVGMKADMMPLIGKGMGEKTLNDTITWGYSDKQEEGEPDTVWTFREVLQDFLGGYHSSGVPFMGIPDTGYDMSIVLESAYSATKIDAKITNALNFDKTPCNDAIRTIAEELQYDGYIDGILLGGRILDLPFEWSQGTVAYDYSGEENDGVLRNMESGDWVTGIRGRGLNFDGVNEDVQVFHASELNPASISISVWVKPTDIAAGDRDICAKSGVFILRQNGADLHWYVWDGTNYEPHISETGVFTAGQWTHIVVTSSPTQQRMYIDNSEVGGSPLSHVYSPTGAIDLFVASSGTKFFYGIIDELQIYNRVLSSQEVEMLYSHQRLRLKLFANGDTATSPAISLSDPFKSISLDHGLADVYNYIRIFGGVDRGYFFPDVLTERAFGKFSPVIWTSDETISDETGATYIKNGDYSIKVASLGPPLWGSDSCYLELDIEEALNQLGFSTVDYINYATRFGGLSFWLYWASNTTPKHLGNAGTLDIILYDSSADEIRYRFRVNRGIIGGRGGYLDIGWNYISIPLFINTDNLDTKKGKNEWYFHNGSTTFDATQVTKMRLIFTTDYDNNAGSSQQVYIDNLIISGGVNINPDENPGLFPSPANASGAYEDATSINTYGVRILNHTDNLIKTFDRAGEEGQRLLAVLKDPIRKIKAIKGAKTWVNPHETITLTKSEYGLSSATMRIIGFIHNYQKGKYLRTELEVVEQYDPTPPVAGGGKRQELIGIPP